MEKHLKNMKNKKYPERFSGKASFFFPHPGAESFILCTVAEVSMSEGEEGRAVR